MAADGTAAGGAGQRALYHAIADPGSLRTFGGEIGVGNPSGWPGYEEQVRRARDATGARHAVTTGVATVAAEPCVIVGFEFAFLGGSMGAAEGARIARAFSVAAAEGLPIVCVAASGGSRMQEGTSALVQMQVVAAAIAEARRAGVPHLAVTGDPTTGGVWSSLIAGADVLIGVPGARVSFSGSRTRPAGADPESGEFLADGKWAHGFVDALVPEDRLRGQVAAILRLLGPRSRGGTLDRAPVPAWPAGADPAGGPARDGWAQVGEARSLRRARAGHWLAAYFGPTFEIRGDRCGGVDDGLRCGFGQHRGSGQHSASGQHRGSGQHSASGQHNGATIAYIAQTGQRTTAAGFRTAARLLGLAARFGRPVLTLIDTPGAAAAPGDEAAGVGTAIAELFVAIASSPVPITSVVIGEGVSGGALALASPTDLWLAQDGYLAVTAPELAASILKLPAGDVPQVAARLRLTPAELLSRGLIHGIVRPPAAARAG